MTQAYLGGKLGLLKVAGVAGGVTWGVCLIPHWSDLMGHLCSAALSVFRLSVY